MNIIQIKGPEDFAAHRGAIELLFTECFGERLSVEVWEWAYLTNPNGAGIASLCYEGERLVGHYAAIPLLLRDDTHVLNVYQSMTTMVSTDYRKEGLFVKLATNTYALARELGIDCVLGFPNAMSTPGFRNKLNWTLPAPDYVATLDKSELLDCLDFFRRHPNQWRLDLDNQRNREWRLSKPGTTCIWDDGLAYKWHLDAIDVLAFDDPGDLARLPEGVSINILVHATVNALRPRSSFEYQFGGVGICMPFDPNKVYRQMGLSDVF
jgi:Acetyltransferase (GNAT) domain